MKYLYYLSFGVFSFCTQTICDSAIISKNSTQEERGRHDRDYFDYNIFSRYLPKEIKPGQEVWPIQERCECGNRRCSDNQYPCYRIPDNFLFVFRCCEIWYKHPCNYKDVYGIKRSARGETKGFACAPFLEGCVKVSNTTEPEGPSTTVQNQNKRIPEGFYGLGNHEGNLFKEVPKIYNENSQIIIIFNNKLPKHRCILIHHSGERKVPTREKTLGCVVFDDIKKHSPLRKLWECMRKKGILCLVVIDAFNWNK